MVFFHLAEKFVQKHHEKMLSEILIFADCRFLASFQVGLFNSFVASSKSIFLLG